MTWLETIRNLLSRPQDFPARNIPQGFPVENILLYADEAKQAAILAVDQKLHDMTLDNTQKGHLRKTALAAINYALPTDKLRETYIDQKFTSSSGESIVQLDKKFTHLVANPFQTMANHPFSTNHEHNMIAKMAVQAVAEFYRDKGLGQQMKKTSPAL